jgi:hypothetical protein
MADGGCGMEVLRLMPPRVCLATNFSRWILGNGKVGAPIRPAHGEMGDLTYLSWSADTPESRLLGHDGDFG